MAIKSKHVFFLGGITSAIGLTAAAVALKRKTNINLLDEIDKNIPNPLFKKVVKNNTITDDDDSSIKDESKTTN